MVRLALAADTMKAATAKGPSVCSSSKDGPVGAQQPLDAFRLSSFGAKVELLIKVLCLHRRSA